MGRLQGKVAVVTGAGQGLGRSTALRFAAEGAKVVVADMNGETAHDAVEAITAAGGEAMAVVIDVSSAHDAERMVSATLAEYGRVDILINNAATFGSGKHIAEIDEEEWDRVMRVNLRGPFLCSKFVIPPLRRQGGGSVVFVSSMSGVVGNELQADYNTSKARPDRPGSLPGAGLRRRGHSRQRRLPYGDEYADDGAHAAEKRGALRCHDHVFPFRRAGGGGECDPVPGQR